MPTPSVAEKNHERDRIATLIEATRARDLARFDRLARAARTQAIASLGLTEIHAELDAIRVAETDLSRRRKAVQPSMIATLRAVPVDEVGDHPIAAPYGSDLGLPHEIAAAISHRQTAHHNSLLTADEVDQALVRLQAEKEHLLDTVWSAVSPTPIKQLWTRVGELLGTEPTRLERDALAVTP